VSKYYAGIGGRETPGHALMLMGSIAIQLEKDGYNLRSGHAKGADQAFESGIRDNLNKDIYFASDATPQSLRHAEEYHPRWDMCKSYTKQLHARNSLIILGPELITPVDFVICWTKNGQVVGGTGQALRIAIDNNIPIFNLHDYAVVQRFEKYIGINDKLDLI
jgi:hypothetical protein